MKLKWYISTLFLIGILFGAFQDQVVAPNQEIILNFVDAKINKKDIENTIADVKEKLLNAGVSNIQIKKTQNSTLKIAYYSTFDVENIKELLTQKSKLALNKNSSKKEKNKLSSNYNFDIHELTNKIDISNSDYKYVFEIKYNSDRFTTNNYSAFLKKLDFNKANQLFKTSFKIHKNSPFTKDRTSYKEPEVRAGPQNYYS
ncbi:hypothetical protein [uncultured Polaribacter sp.]|uniref:hypothetical protein n=1 Tax=uncultured Polaribacter sp. TaxID=174711 RepID=UPI002611E958|nr:hypothetical protein [uncultured Polaribacter sp.]